MDNLQDRLVVVPFGALDDTLEMTRALLERIPHDDPLAVHLRGSMAHLRQEVLPEP